MDPNGSTFNDAGVAETRNCGTSHCMLLAVCRSARNVTDPAPEECRLIGMLTCPEAHGTSNVTDTQEDFDNKKKENDLDEISEIDGVGGVKTKTRRKSKNVSVLI